MTTAEVPHTSCTLARPPASYPWKDPGRDHHTPC